MAAKCSAVVMLAILRSTVDCNCTVFDHKGLCHFVPDKTFMVETLYNHNLLCYVKWPTSQLPFKAIDMSLYHINKVLRGGAMTGCAWHLLLLSSPLPPAQRQRTGFPRVLPCEEDPPHS